MADEPSEKMREDVSLAFGDAVRLFDSWRFDTPAPTLPFKAIAISLSGVCDLTLAYKNERVASTDRWRRVRRVNVNLEAQWRLLMAHDLLS
jgi:hypothetical protein